ncbi:response regulator [Sulfurimonas lithotrophica]|uniref:histidine kinase n=1 Tax=Sulfurimonas lithotrophica TaxID=2590022 RepID=A0A5P8NYA9_9BACT|nr:response regulator [Sulfurimonas lithotrophica]QFR48425.1 response regulator [Sulfurimonas lithotrophica]
MASKDISILFVEDDDDIRAEISEYLQEYTFKNIYTVTNGQEGINSYIEYKPDIILTDLRMPILDGLEMSRHIKSINEDIPIILFTSLFEKEITEAAVDIGIDAYLFKPISKERLEKVLCKYKNRIIQKRKFLNEQKLLEEYKGAIDASAAVTKTDKNGVITYANDAFCEMSGYTKEELIGKAHNIVKHPETIDAVYLDMWKTITNKKIWHGRLKNLNKNGRTYYQHSVIVPIINEDNEIEEYIALRQDITDLFHQEEYLKKRIKEEVDKNLQLHKEKEEAKLLEEKFSIIGKMAAGITHEINTPLTYVRGNLEFLLKDIDSLDEDVKQKAYLLEDSKTIFSGINRIASIVESMREVASQAKEKPEINNIYASLITALTLSYNKSKFISNVKLIDEIFNIGMNKDKYNFSISVQKQRIEQVFVIIINNALDALKLKDDFDSRIFEIYIENTDEYLIVNFKDNAGGIDEDILPKIFNPFQSSKEEGGMGIGLNVAKRIIDDHGGKIIASNVDEGALFQVHLPHARELVSKDI